MSTGRPSQGRRHRAPREQRLKRGRGGFTSIELVVTVAIVAALAAAVAPGYIRGTQKARRIEALVALRSIHDAQTFHYANEQQYTNSFAVLGWDLEGGSLREDGAYDGPGYTYTLNNWDVGDEINGNYRATATGNVDPSDAVLDIIIIENTLTVTD